MESSHQPGDIITERYRITGTLGQGGIGITYAAEDLKSGQQVALKALSFRQMGDWKTLELFEREAKILAQLNHPAIPRYLDYFQVDTPEDRGFYIAQELVEGKSLADLVKNGWRTNETGVRRIAEQVLSILVYLHDLKPSVVHRDIKPQNLIWGKDGKIFLVDFGAVQDTYRSTFAKGSTIVGTYGYMAPEQFRGQAVPGTDLYGLGATLLFLLTHRSPSDLPQERLKISFRSRIQVSEGFADWLEKMLEPDAEDRFASAKNALAALQGRMVVAKPQQSVSWKVLVGVGVAGVVAVTVLNSYKWTVLSALGFQPSGICEAATSRRIDIVRDYLKHGGDLNAKDDTEAPILPCFLEMENVTKDIAEFVIAGLPDVNAKDEQGMTPLHRVGSKEVAQLLIAKGADVSAKDNQGMTPLHRVGSKEVAQLLIAKGADVSAKDNQGMTSLHRVGSKEVAQLLIAKGADVNAKDKQGMTPLYFVSSEASKELAEVLIAKGADINAKDSDGKTLLHCIVSQSNGFYYGGEGACKGYPGEVAKRLIAKGADVNAVDNQGQAPLHLALANAWSAEYIAELLAKGAQANTKDNKGATPLHYAAIGFGHYGTFGFEEVIELLLANGSQINDRDNEGKTPLKWAAEHGYTYVVELLRSYGGTE